MTENHILCSAVAVAEHYLWLVAFLWMNALSWNAMKTFRAKGLQDKSKASRCLICFCAYAWGVPGAITGACAVVEFSNIVGFRIGYGDESVCWITELYALLLTFALPLGLILLTNFLFFSLTVRSIFRVSQLAKEASDGNQCMLFWSYLKLSSLMGLTWIIGFLASGTGLPELWYVFIVSNSILRDFSLLWDLQPIGGYSRCLRAHASVHLLVVLVMDKVHVHVANLPMTPAARKERWSPHQTRRGSDQCSFWARVDTILGIFKPRRCYGIYV
jgi:hypothetical protein